MEAAKRERTTSKRLLTTAQNRVEKAITDGLNIDIVESRFREADKRMNAVIEKHELYVEIALTDGEETQSIEDEWLKAVMERHERMEEKVKAAMKETAVPVEAIPVDSEVALQRKCKRACKYEESLLTAAIDSLRSITVDEGATVETIKEAQLEMRARLDSYRAAQREFALIVSEDTMGDEIKVMKQLVSR